MKDHSKRPFRTTFLVLLTTLLGCTQQPSTQSTKTNSVLAVATTSPMMTEFVTRMLGTTTDVRLTVPAERSSRDWRPSRTAATELRDAQLLVLTGAGWEPWSERVSLAPTRTVDLSGAIKQFLIEVPDAVTHQHGPDGAHSHKGFVPHTWLSPQLLLLQLPDLETALLKAHPDSRETIQREAGRLRTSLQPLASLAADLRTQLQEQKLAVVTDGPEFLYLLRDLGVDPIRIRWPVSSPVNAAITEQIRQAAQHNNAALDVFIINSRRPIGAEQPAVDAGFRVLRLDDLEQASSEQNAVARLTSNLRTLQALTAAIPPTAPQ
ncbi:MAG: metal ABC transporter solute-binding protein, Zn/Mn family [Planctomyces sp.]